MNDFSYYELDKASQNRHDGYSNYETIVLNTRCYLDW